MSSDKVVVRTKHNRHNDDEELCESRRPAAPPRCDLTPTRLANWNRWHDCSRATAYAYLVSDKVLVRTKRNDDHHSAT